MGFPVLTQEELHQLMIAMSRNTIPEYDHSRNSDQWKRLRINSGGTADVEAYVSSVDRDSLPDTAIEGKLTRWAALFGITKRGATKARGELVALVRGTAASTWTTSDVLSHPSGQTYVPTAGGTIPAPGEQLIGVEAVVAGSEGVLQSGEILTWETPPAGLEDEVELQGDLDSGGQDIESDGALSARLAIRIADPTRGGATQDFIDWTLEASDDIANGYPYSHRNGKGSVDVAALKSGSGSARLLSLGERTTLSDYLDSGIAPSMMDTIRVLEVQEETQDFDIQVSPVSGTQYVRDWTDATPLVVSTWTLATRTLVFTTARPDSMSVGGRLIVAGTSGVELEIESLSGADAVVLVSARGQTPAGAANVYSGGPLIQPTRAAIQSLVDSLGPALGSFGSGWVGTLFFSQLFEAVQTTAGVLDSNLTTPAADVVPTDIRYPADDTIVNLLTVGDMLVRYE